jgi:F-type H+-transporting ATPase subunit delta
LRPLAIARNYAEALFALGEKSGQTAVHADLLDALAGVVETSPKVEAVLMSPRITKTRKSEILAGALEGAPKEFILFIKAMVKRGRQGWFRETTTELNALLDLKLNRIRAGVTTASPADAALKTQITKALERITEKEVIAHFETEPTLIGGVVVRMGGRVYDGSIRRRVTVLRRKLLTT